MSDEIPRIGSESEATRFDVAVADTFGRHQVSIHKGWQGVITIALILGFIGYAGFVFFGVR